MLNYTLHQKIVMWKVCVISMKFLLSCWLTYWTINSWQSGNNFQETQTFKIQIFGLLMFVHIYIVVNDLQPCTFSSKNSHTLKQNFYHARWEFWDRSLLFLFASLPDFNKRCLYVHVLPLFCWFFRHKILHSNIFCSIKNEIMVRVKMLWFHFPLIVDNCQQWPSSYVDLLCSLLNGI